MKVGTRFLVMTVAIFLITTTVMVFLGKSPNAAAGSRGSRVKSAHFAGTKPGHAHLLHPRAQAGRIQSRRRCPDKRLFRARLDVIYVRRPQY